MMTPDSGEMLGGALSRHSQMVRAASAITVPERHQGISMARIMGLVR